MADNQEFNVFHQEFADWCDQVDVDLASDCCCPTTGITGTVVEKLIALGFTITPPPMPRFAVLYNGRVVIRIDTREQAEHALRGHNSSPSFEIRDKEAP